MGSIIGYFPMSFGLGEFVWCWRETKKLNLLPYFLTTNQSTKWKKKKKNQPTIVKQSTHRLKNNFIWYIVEDEVVQLKHKQRTSGIFTKALLEESSSILDSWWVFNNKALTGSFKVTIFSLEKQNIILVVWFKSVSCGMFGN